jgi:hypothetical protein
MFHSRSRVISPRRHRGVTLAAAGDLDLVVSLAGRLGHGGNMPDAEGAGAALRWGLAGGGWGRHRRPSVHGGWGGDPRSCSNGAPLGMVSAQAWGGVVAVGLGSLLGPPSVRPPVAQRYVGRRHDARCRPRCGVVLGILLITEISGTARAHDY